MTQLIGAMCEDRTKVILVSDRMVTTGDGSLAFEHEPKFAMVSRNAIVLTAGNVLEPELIEDARGMIGESAPIRQIAEYLSESYRHTRRIRVEQEVLEQFGFLSFEDFHDRQQRLHEDTNLRLLKMIDDYKLEVVLVLGGVDRRAHLYIVDDPGACRSFDALGFCCVGSGDRHAEPVFAFYEFKPSMLASEALQIVYEAKKRAEMAGGVGRETDAWIITKEGCYEIDKETLQRLQEFSDTKETMSRFRKEFEIKTKLLEYTEHETGNSER